MKKQILRITLSAMALLGASGLCMNVHATPDPAFKKVVKAVHDAVKNGTVSDTEKAKIKQALADAKKPKAMRENYAENTLASLVVTLGLSKQDHKNIIDYASKSGIDGLEKFLRISEDPTLKGKFQTDKRKTAVARAQKTVRKHSPKQQDDASDSDTDDDTGSDESISEDEQQESEIVKATKELASANATKIKELTENVARVNNPKKDELVTFHDARYTRIVEVLNLYDLINAVNQEASDPNGSQNALQAAQTALKAAYKKIKDDRKTKTKQTKKTAGSLVIRKAELSNSKQKEYDELIKQIGDAIAPTLKWTGGQGGAGDQGDAGGQGGGGQGDAGGQGGGGQGDTDELDLDIEL